MSTNAHGTEDEHTCRRCGLVYGAFDQDPPENATIYWEPHCPYCNAKLTANDVDAQWVQICLDSYRRHAGDDEYDGEGHLDRIQLWARCLHDRYTTEQRQHLPPK